MRRKGCVLIFPCQHSICYGGMVMGSLAVNRPEVKRVVFVSESAPGTFISWFKFAHRNALNLFVCDIMDLDEGARVRICS